MSLAHLLHGQGTGSGARPVPVNNVTLSWVQHPRGGGTGGSYTDEGVFPPVGHLPPCAGRPVCASAGSRGWGGCGTPVFILCSAIPEKSDSFRMETRLFSAPNYFKNTSFPCPKNTVPCHALFCVTWLSSHWLFPGFSCGRTLCTSLGSELLRIALITQSIQHGLWGTGKSLGTPDAPAMPGLCSESHIQRRDLLSLAAEPSLSWRWGSLTLLSQTLQRTGAPDAKLGSFSWWSWAVAAWLCPGWCSGWRLKAAQGVSRTLC